MVLDIMYSDRTNGEKEEQEGNPNRREKQVGKRNFEKETCKTDSERLGNMVTG